MDRQAIIDLKKQCTTLRSKVKMLANLTDTAIYSDSYTQVESLRTQIESTYQ